MYLWKEAIKSYAVEGRLIIDQRMFIPYVDKQRVVQ